MPLPLHFAYNGEHLRFCVSRLSFILFIFPFPMPSSCTPTTTNINLCLPQPILPFLPLLAYRTYATSPAPARPRNLGPRHSDSYFHPGRCPNPSYALLQGSDIVNVTHAPLALNAH